MEKSQKAEMLETARQHIEIGSTVTVHMQGGASYPAKSIVAADRASDIHIIYTGKGQVRILPDSIDHIEIGETKIIHEGNWQEALNEATARVLEAKIKEGDTNPLAAVQIRAAFSQTLTMGISAIDWENGARQRLGQPPIYPDVGIEPWELPIAIDQCLFLKSGKAIECPVNLRRSVQSIVERHATQIGCGVVEIRPMNIKGETDDEVVAKIKRGIDGNESVIFLVERDLENKDAFERAERLLSPYITDPDLNALIIWF